MNKIKNINVTNVLLVTLALISVGFQVSNNLRRPNYRGGGAPESSVKVGTVLKSATVLSGSEKPVTLPLAERGPSTLVYVFSPKCHWCDVNMPNMLALSSKVPMVGVSISGTAAEIQKFSQEKGIKYPVYALSDEGKKSFRVGTPFMAEIDNTGTVKQVWAGAWLRDKERKMDTLTPIETKFGVKLQEVALPKSQTN